MNDRIWIEKSIKWVVSSDQLLSMRKFGNKRPMWERGVAVLFKQLNMHNPLFNYIINMESCNETNGLTPSI